MGGQLPGDGDGLLCKICLSRPTKVAACRLEGRIEKVTPADLH